jgi:sulfatase maturation enzyme AslB (radical SAM superfamily)
MTINRDTFCILPWVGMNVHLDGGLAPCCMQEHVNITHKFDQWETWRDQGLHELKTDLVQGKRNPRCDRCWRLEDQGVDSYRQRWNLHLKSHPIFLDHADPWQQYDLEFLHLDFDSYCNLKCVMCHPTVSSSLATEYTTHQDRLSEFFGHVTVNNQRWHESAEFKNFVEQIHNIKVLILTGGEPLINPRVIALLRALPLENIKLIVTTNATTIRPEVLAQLKRSASLGITVSLEGIGIHNDYLRYGSTWSHIHNNIETLAALPNCEVISINHVLQHTSIWTLPAVVDYALINQHEINIHKLTFPSWLSIAGVPVPQRQTVLDALAEQLLQVHRARFPASFRTWLQSAMTEISTTLYDPAVAAQFQKYMSTLDNIRGTNFAQVFSGH